MSAKSPVKKIKLEKKLSLKKDFPAPSFHTWKEQVEKDLKGTAFEKLISNTYEGINLNPIYTPLDIDKLAFTEDFPGSKSFVRGFSPSSYFQNAWNVNQEILTADVSEYNVAIHEALNNGQNCINLSLDSATKFGLDADYAETVFVGDSGLSISAINSMKRALNEIDLTTIPVYADTGYNNIPFLSLLNAHFKANGLDFSRIRGAVTADPIAHLVLYGDLPVSLDYIFEMLKESIKWTNKYASNLRTISVNTLPFLNAGSNSVQELAISLAIIVYYINQLLDRDVDPIETIKKTIFNFGIGNNYFMEISKFRAAKVLLNNIAENYNMKIADNEFMISAKSAHFYQSNLDPYVNMLRSTTQAFSAILGGVNSLTTIPFDETLRKSDSFSRRIARNTQTILREESHLDAVIDPAGGSYYIENLTEQLAYKAWELFQTIEKEGGILYALSSGFIQNILDENLKKRKNDIGKRKSVIIGTNMFADINEKKLDHRKVDQTLFKKERSEYLRRFRLNGTKEKHEKVIEMLNSISNSKSKDIIDTITEAYLLGTTLGEVTSFLNSSHKEKLQIKKIISRRASEDFEELRNKALKLKIVTGELPKVFLANYGSLNEFKARADFSKGFFEIGGFEVINSEGSVSNSAIVDSALSSGAQIIVICSTDENYPKIVDPLVKGIKEKKSNIHVILAGYPKDQIEDHKNSGVDDFIFLGANSLDKLSSLLDKIGGDVK